MPDLTTQTDIDDFMSSASYAAARTKLGLGTAATAETGDFATSAQGATADTALQPSDVGAMAFQDADSVDIANGSAVLSNLTCGNVNLTGGSINDFVSGVLHPSDIGTLVLAPDGDASALTNIPNPFDQSLNVADNPTFATINGLSVFCANANQVQFNRGTAQFLIVGGGGLAGASFNGVALGTAAGSNTSAFQAADADLSSWALITRASGFDTFTATPSSANLRSLLTDETGTGAAVFATSPTLVTPVLGTPTSGTLTNCTLPISGVTGLGTRIVTFLVTPSSANLASAVQDGTGSGALVLATSPALVTPDLGTPSAGVLTNATGTAASLTAGNATKWTTGRTIALTGGVTYTSGSLDGSGNVTGTATVITNANLTGDVTSSGNATTIATVANVVAGTLAAARGGTGVSNTGTITLAGNLVTTGAFNTTFAQAATTTVTLPSTSATMARTDAFQTFATRQDVTGTVRITNFVDPSSGAGMELQYDPALSKGNILCYDRSASTYKAFSFDASSELFYNSGTLRFSISTGGVAVTGSATISTTLAVTGATTGTGLITANGGVTVGSGQVLKLGNLAATGLTPAVSAGLLTKSITVQDSGGNTITLYGS